MAKKSNKTDLQKYLERISDMRGLSLVEKQRLKQRARQLASAKGDFGPAGRSKLNLAIRTAVSRKTNDPKRPGGQSGGGTGSGTGGGTGGGSTGGGGETGGGTGDGGTGDGGTGDGGTGDGGTGDGGTGGGTGGGTDDGGTGTGGGNESTKPGKAWIWDGSKWVKPPRPTDGKPYFWDDDAGWTEDVVKQQQRQDAFDTLSSWLSYYGIDDGGSLSELLWGWVEQDKSTDWIRLELRKTDQYKARFPGMEAMSKKGMAITEAEYIANERSYLQVLKAAGMPTSFYDDRQDFANFMIAEVSPQELASRVQVAKDYVQLYAPKSVKDQLKGLYGFTDEQMAAYVLDTSPEKMKSLAAIESEYVQRKSQAQVGGAAVDAGFNLTDSLRDQIASMGYDYNQSAAGLTGVKTDAPLYSRLGALYGEKTSTDELVQETFGLGGGAEVATKKRKLASRERAAFGGTTGIGASSLGRNQAGRQ